MWLVTASREKYNINQIAAIFLLANKVIACAINKSKHSVYLDVGRPLIFIISNFEPLKSGPCGAVNRILFRSQSNAAKGRLLGIVWCCKSTLDYFIGLPYPIIKRTFWVILGYDLAPG